MEPFFVFQVTFFYLYTYYFTHLYILDDIELLYTGFLRCSLDPGRVLVLQFVYTLHAFPV